MSSHSNTNESLSRARMLAANPTTSGEELKALSIQFDCPQVLAYIAGNPSSPPDLLSKLASHQDTDVRIGVCDNPSAAVNTIRQLSKDDSADVRYCLAENHNIPLKILTDLAGDENPWVAARATRSMKNLGIDLDTSPSEHHLENVIRVLIAEDNKHIQFLIARILEKDPNIRVVFEAEDGRATVEKTIACQPEIVLMDISMPSMNGVDATRLIKEKAPSTKVIMVTGSDSDEDIAAAFRAGADGYFLKSTPFSELPNCIKTVADNANWLDPGISSAILKKCFDRSNAKTGKTDIDVALKVLNAQIDQLVKEQAFEDAVILCQAMTKICDRLYGKSAEPTVESLARLADIYFMNQEYQVSELLLLQAIENNQGFLTNADENADHVIAILGQTAEKKGNFQQAELYYTWSLRICEKLGQKSRIEAAKVRLKTLTQSKSG